MPKDREEYENMVSNIRKEYPDIFVWNYEDTIVTQAQAELVLRKFKVSDSSAFFSFALSSLKCDS